MAQGLREAAFVRDAALSGTTLQGLGLHHDHDAPGGHEAGERALLIALVLNAVFLVFELVVGWWSNSLALLSDAGHMVTDVGALGLALAAQRLSHRSMNAQYTYGLHRVPVLGGLANAASLFVVVVLIIREAVERLGSPVEITAWPVLLMGVAGLVVNAGSAWVIHRSGEHSVNMRGAFLHLFADMLGSIAATASAVVLMTTGWTAIDPILSLLIALLIAAGSWPLMRDTLAVILERAPASVDVERVEALLERAEAVARVIDLHVWEVGPDQTVLTAILVHASPGSLVASNAESDRLRGQLEELGIQHVTLEWRDPETPSAAPCYFEHQHDHDHASP